MSGAAIASSVQVGTIKSTPTSVAKRTVATVFPPPSAVTIGATQPMTVAAISSIGTATRAIRQAESAPARDAGNDRWAPPHRQSDQPRTEHRQDGTAHDAQEREVGWQQRGGKKERRDVEQRCRNDERERRLERSATPIEARTDRPGAAGTEGISNRTGTPQEVRPQTTQLVDLLQPLARAQQDEKERTDENTEQCGVPDDEEEVDRFTERAEPAGQRIDRESLGHTGLASCRDALGLDDTVGEEVDDQQDHQDTSENGAGTPKFTLTRQGLDRTQQPIGNDSTDERESEYEYMPGRVGEKCGG